MRRWTARLLAAGLGAVVGLAAASPAWGVEAFLAEFQAKYVKPESQKPNDVALAVAFEQAHCTICHPGDDTHRLTPYGGKLAWRISKLDKKDKKKIRAALEHVASLRSDPGDPKSPTYGDLLRQGRLPPASAR